MAQAALPASGSYTFTHASAAKTVTWNTVDMTYVVSNGGGVFGWAQFNGRRYERITRPVTPKRPATIWYDRGPGGNPLGVVSAKSYPRDLAQAVLRGARSVSGRDNVFTVTGTVTMDGVQTPVTTTTIRFGTNGRIVSITNGKLRLTVADRAPSPLIRASEITSELD